MIDAVMEGAAGGRVDAGYLFLGVLLAVANAISMIALSDRIHATRQLPFAYGRVLLVLVGALGFLGAQLVMLAGLDDVRVWRPDLAAGMGGGLVIVLTVLLASLVRADEEAAVDARPWVQFPFFVLATTAMHQIAVLERLLDGWDTLRVLAAVGSAALSFLLVLPFLPLFVGRQFENRSPLPAGIVMGLAASLPFGAAQLVVFAASADAGLPLGAAQEALRLGAVAGGVALLAAIHGIGWVLAWRASLRQALARREVRVLQASLDAVLDDTPDWVAVLSETGEVLATGGRWVRGPLERTLGDGESLLDALDASVSDDLRAFLAQARGANGGPLVREIRFRGPEGREEVSELRILDRTGDPQLRGVILVARSRTDQLAQQAELENQRRIYRRIFEQAPVPVFVVDGASHAILDVNPAACAMYGWAREELLGRETETVVAPEDHGRVRDFRAALDRGDAQPTEILATHLRAEIGRAHV
mgnify:FL=1